MNITDSKDLSQNDPTPLPGLLTPETANVYIMIDENHKLHLFFDAAGKEPMDNATPLDALTGNRRGRVCFNFIKDPSPGHHGNVIETADLIIIAQTEADRTRPAGVKKGSPFVPPNNPAYYIPDPAPESDPGNLKGSLPGTDGVVVAGCLAVRNNGVENVPYKYAIVALCDDGAIFTDVDPIVIIKPN
jgi:hypothetical protein